MPGDLAKARFFKDSGLIVADALLSSGSLAVESSASAVADHRPVGLLQSFLITFCSRLLFLGRRQVNFDGGTLPWAWLQVIVENLFTPVPAVQDGKRSRTSGF